MSMQHRRELLTYGTKHDVHESIVDDALEKLTFEAMKEVFHNYQDRMDMKNVEKYIELEVSKIISPWIPDKYTEVDVEAWIGDTYSTIIAEFMTDGRTMMVVAHEEKTPKLSFGESLRKTINRPYTKERLDAARKQEEKENFSAIVKEILNTPMELGVSPRGCGSTPEERIKAFNERIYDPTSLTEDFTFPYPAPARGSEVEVVPEVAKTNNLGVVHDERIDWSQLSSVDMERALEPFDAKGTCGWSQEYTITTTDNKPIWVSSYNPDERFRITTGNGDTWVAMDKEGNVDISTPNSIEFTIDELDELIDFLDEVQSEVMKFE